MSFDRKKFQNQVLIFPFQPPIHVLFNRKMADELMKAKMHSSAMTNVEFPQQLVENR